MLRVVLVDDEKLALDELSYIVAQVNYIKIVGQFTDASEALQFVCVEEPDLVFLDISMPGISGIAFIEKLNSIGIKSKVIFATASDEYAVKAFEQDAVDYVLKPYEPDRIFKALVKAKRACESVSPFSEFSKSKVLSKLPIWKGEKVVFVDVEDIVYMEIVQNHVKIYTDHDVYEMNECMSALEEKLPKNIFFRSHRSFIINLTKVGEASPYFNHTMMVKMKNRLEEIPVSRSFVKQFKQMLNIK